MKESHELNNGKEIQAMYLFEFTLHHPYKTNHTLLHQDANMYSLYLREYLKDSAMNTVVAAIIVVLCSIISSIRNGMHHTIIQPMFKLSWHMSHILPAFFDTW